MQPAAAVCRLMLNTTLTRRQSLECASFFGTDRYAGRARQEMDESTIPYNAVFGSANISGPCPGVAGEGQISP